MRLPIDTESANFENEKTTQLARTIEIDDASLLVSVEQAASILGIGRTRASELVMGRTITSVKIGRRRLVVRKSLEEFIQRLVAAQESSDDEREVTCATGRHPLRRGLPTSRHCAPSDARDRPRNQP